MAEVLVEFDAAIAGPEGVQFAPRACTRVSSNGLWEGWLEFTDVETGSVVRSGRETTQPTRDDVMYWATGLSHVYLEGALSRALRPHRAPAPAVHVEPAFDGPAPVLEPVEMPLVPRAVIDPFEVFAQGERVLREELSALSVDHLHAIIRAHGLEGGAGAQALTPEVLAEYIVAEVRARVDRAEARRLDALTTPRAASPYRDADGAAS
jgi:hypothetical protein